MSSSNRQIISFFGYLILQIILSRFVDFGPLLYIAIYPLFIMTLDTSVSHNKILLLSFIMGVCVDLTTGQIVGLSSAATLLMALLQPRILRLIIAHKMDLENFNPGFNSLGFSRFMAYLLILLAIHHISFSLIESFDILFFLQNLPRLGISFVANALLMMVIEYGINRVIGR